MTIDPMTFVPLLHCRRVTRIRLRESDRILTTNDLIAVHPFDERTSRRAAEERRSGPTFGLSLSSARTVSIPIEISEKKPKKDCVKSYPPHKSSRIVAGAKQQLERMDKNGDELDHLDRGHVLFPKEISVHLRSD